MNKENNTKLGERVFRAIKERKIKPKAKWKFFLRDYLVWFISLFSVLVGSIAFSVVLYMLRASDWDIYKNINDSLIEFFIATLPYFWIVILIVFIAIADYNFKHTEKGYKYETYLIAIVSFFLSILMGYFLFNFGVGKAIDNSLADKIPFYKQTINKMHEQERRWDRPQKGFLSGIIISMNNKRDFKISDLSGDIWNVDARGAEIHCFKNLQLKAGLRIFGRVLEEEAEGEERKFKAAKIFYLPRKSWMMHERMIEQAKKRGIMLPHHPGHMELDGSRNKPEADDKEKIGADCRSNLDCETPFSYRLKSNCPFESKCIRNSCKVVCEMPRNLEQNRENGEVGCSENSNCDCGEFYKQDIVDCICLDNNCAAVVAE